MSINDIKFAFDIKYEQTFLAVSDQRSTIRHTEALQENTNSCHSLCLLLFRFEVTSCLRSRRFFLCKGHVH